MTMTIALSESHLLDVLNPPLFLAEAQYSGPRIGHQMLLINDSLGVHE